MDQKTYKPGPIQVKIHGTYIRENSQPGLKPRSVNVRVEGTDHCTTQVHLPVWRQVLRLNCVP